MKKSIKTALVSILIFLMFRMYGTDFFVQVFDMEDFSFVSALKILMPYSLINCLSFIVLFIYVDKYISYLNNKKLDKIAAIFFGLCFMAGNCASTVGAFAETFYSKRMLVFYAIYMLGLFWAFRFVLFHLRKLIVRIVNSRIQYRFSYKQQFWLTFLILSICWLPYVVLRFPAGFEMDAYFQVADFLEGTMTAHWPPASSAFMGIFVLIGQKLFNSADIGIFMYCLLQIIIGSAIFAYALIAMRTLRVPAIWTYISIAVFALVPVYPGYITSVVKDAPFAYMVTLFVVLLVQCIYAGESYSRLIGLFISGILVCILRNNGIFIVGGIILAMILAYIILRRITGSDCVYDCLFLDISSIIGDSCDFRGGSAVCSFSANSKTFKPVS